MAEYSVEITNKSAGIVFHSNGSDNDNDNMVSDVIGASIGDNLGICVGDKLIGINDVDIEELLQYMKYSTKNIQYIFYDQDIPFKATFIRADIIKPKMISVEEDEDGNNINGYSFGHMNINICEYSDTDSESTLFGDELGPSIGTYSPKTHIEAYHAIVRTAKTLSNVEKFIPNIKTFNTNINNEINIIHERGVSRSETIDCNSYIIQEHKYIKFDKIIINNTNKVFEHKICLLSSKGFRHGSHEWIIKIRKCDIYRQEIGVIGTNNIDEIGVIDDGGIKLTNKCGARSVYGNESCMDCVYYGSYNEDGTQRCYRNLINKYHIHWNSGDTIKVCINLDKWRIKYFLNNKKVRKPMSLQKNKMYYPIICFAGNSMYELISFN